MADKHSPHTTTIIVNGQPKEWAEKEITYQQVIQLAFPGAGTNQDYTVTYSHGHQEGQLVATSAPVKIHKHMEFDVDGTDNS